MLSLPSVYDSAQFEGKPSHKLLKQLKKINQYASIYENLPLDALKRYARGFDVRLQKQGVLNVEKLYACAREVTFRLLGKRHYDVQIIGALAALERNAIQMSTGSGKTITLILPALAHGLTHKGCHVLTVNDYLSKRDWLEVKPVYDFFGITSAYVDPDSDVQTKHAGFLCDITYCTNNTVGFAYLDSCLASGIGMDIKIIDRPLYAALIDEMDEILMDDARNPLIMAQSKSLAESLNRVVHRGRVFQVPDILDKLRGLKYLEYDEDQGGEPFIGEKTWDEIQTLFNMDDTLFGNPKFMHVIDQSIQALFKLKRYVDYEVSPEPDPNTGSRITLIDQATGRLTPGRTLNDNLHAFVEMKEGVFTGSASESTLQITYQVLFNLYTIIAGVTGTLGTSYKEFDDIYQCGIVVVPDKYPSKLQQQTRLYPTYHHLWQALVDDVLWMSKEGYPILIGAASDGDARMVSDLLIDYQIDHKTLLSINTDHEDHIVETSGHTGSIVVTTDIMGRGTDIHLTDSTKDAGLVVFQIGPRPNSRVERQFAGRAGRQGLPGAYFRLLCITDWDSMGWFQSDLDSFLNLRHTKIKGYHGDLLMNGRHPDYDRFVNQIDHLLHAKESTYSQGRIQAFKSGSMVDLIQTSYIKQMDENRSAIKESLEGYHYPLIRQVAYWSLPEEGRKYDWALTAQEEYLVGISADYLREKLFQFTQRMVQEFIPALRSYADIASETVQLGSQAGINSDAEIRMHELIQQFLNDTWEMRQIDL